MEDVIEELNRGVADDRGLRLELSRWETDAYPGFHSDGPQGLIDPVLKIEECDILLGIFWKRFGTPTGDARSGTEHEIRHAIQSRPQSGRPQIMIYFKEAEFLPHSEAELEQYRLVLRFRDEFPQEGLYWAFKDVAEFERLTRNHLMNLIRSQFDHAAPQDQSSDSRELQAALRGPGAAGERGILIDGDVKDSVIVTGDGSRVYAGPHAGTAVRDAADSLKIYRRVLAGAESYLPLRGIERAASDPAAGRKPLELARVYVDLETRSRVPVKKGKAQKREREQIDDDLFQ
ncbi:MAG: DUF4062 domain-containing protein [bacterium]|nr:DUF4062 domain-containing protein [bacterium]